MSSTLLPRVVSFLLGLWLGSYLPYIPFFVMTIFIGLAIGLTWCERKDGLTSQTSLILYVCLLAGVGFWTIGEWGKSSMVLLSTAGEEEVWLSGLVAEPVQHAPGRMTMLVQVISIGEGEMKKKVQGLLRLTWREPDAHVHRGDDITVRARLRAPFGTRNTGGFDYGAYLQQRGVEAVAMVKGPDQIHVISPDSTNLTALFWSRIDQWRNQVRQAVLSNLTDPARGLFLGMIVGEQSYIDQEVRDDFMTTGTVHIISISGSHLGLLAFLSFMSVRGLTRRMPAPWLERLSCRITPKQLAVVITLPLVVFYTLLSGAQVATVRSLVMIALYLLAVWFGHERQIIMALGVSVLLATLFDPMLIYDLSFQLSYVSVLAIALAIALAIQLTQGSEEECEDVQSFGERIQTWLHQYLLISCAATLATLPLVAYYFNQVAWLGVVANMAVVPFVGLFVVPLGLLSSILALVFDLESLPLAWLSQLILDGLSVLVHFIARAPGAEWHVASPAPLAIVGFYLCLLFVFLHHRPVLRWASAVILMGLIVWWIWSPRLIVYDDTLRTTFLDVGQGDATLLELPDGQTVLIDGGVAYERWDMGRMVVGPYLWDRGIRKIDHLVATHPQLDHVGGLAWIIQHFDVGHYWTNGVPRVEPFYQRLSNVVDENRLIEQVAWAGQDLIEGSTCQLRSLNPPRKESGMSQPFPENHSGAELNNLSVVLSLTCGNHSILLNADAEVESLERMANESDVQSATLVKIPHHGAKSSFSKDWFNQLTAKIAVVSAGQRNRYGHPASSVLKHYDQKGMEVYRTDRDGAVMVSQKLHSTETVIQTTQAQVLSVVDLDRNVLQQEAKNLRRLWGKWSGVY
ncbi:MAG: DNA internalization-related competence protein ComEC/Rec2 [Nitrospirae bacterium]|nr:DNA internalization-related competence protein ComEC/Rec2 [Nitrospirota bacterium]